MKIIYIVVKNIPFAGGIEKFTEEIGLRLARKGHEVIVYSMKHYGLSSSVYKGVCLKPVCALKLKIFEKMSAAFFASIDQAKEKKVDIIHYHAFGPAMFAFIPRLQGRKVVVQGHGLEWRRSRWGWLVKFFLKVTEILSVRFPHIVTSDSREQQKYVKERYGKDSICIPNGVNPPVIQQPDLIKIYGLEKDDYIFFASRLVKEKGVHYLIEAYKRLKTSLKLVIAGDTLYETDYKKLLYNLVQDNRNIILTGSIRGRILEELFSNCYFFVLPSEVEGLSTVLLEAMSYGNCCLVSDIAENKEALNSFGYTFKSRDIKDLTQKMQYLIDNREAVNAVKGKAKEYVLENYSWDKIAKQCEDLYFKLSFSEVKQ